MTDRRDEIAESLRRRIMSGMHLGALRPGTRLPSTREVAREFGVAPRTAMAAYQALEAEGMVERRERSGIYVAPGDEGGALLTQLAGWVVDVLVEAREREVPPTGFPERVRECLETRRLRAVCVASNADQLDHICHELREDYGIETDGVYPEQLAQRDSETVRLLARAELFVSTAAFSALVHRVAKEFGSHAISVALRTDLMSDITRALAAGPVYFVGSDPRFRGALQAVFAPTGHAHNLHAVILGESDPETIPEDAVIYVMRRAHEQLADTEFARRVAPLRRVFSREMARDLLAFIIRANMAAMAGRAM